MAAGVSAAVLVSLGWLAAVRPAVPQGMATGGTERPARPLPAGMKPPAVDYRDLAPEAGLTAANISGAERNKQYIVETTGTGVALFDFDSDGLIDIFFVNASRFESDAPAASHHLYKNLGDLKFRDVTEKSGIGHTGWGQGTCAGDFDNDGRTDLFITYWGQNALYRNAGGGQFRDETKARGLVIPKRRWGTGCAFLDYDRDGSLDLFVANYVDFDPAKTPKPGDRSQCQWKGLPVICGPRGLPGESMSLYHNDGNGRFTEVSEQAGVTTPRRFYGFTVLTGDFDNDGWPDVYVACDSTASLFFRNKQDGTFEEMGLMSGTAVNEDGREQAGMGATAGDFDGDGRLDIFKTNFSDDTPTLYRNDGNGVFTDNTVAAGLAVNTKFLGWGTAFLDFDQDGWKDIIEANGHVYPEVESKGISEKYKQPRVLYWNRGDAQFYDISRAAGAGISGSHSSRGIATADLDNDGTMEVVIVNMHEGPSLLKNFGPHGNSVLVEALTGSGRAAIGARVTLKAAGRSRIDEVRSGGFHISQGDFRIHFGLASESKAELDVRWPDGTSERLGSISANTQVTLQQGKGIRRQVPLDKNSRL